MITQWQNDHATTQSDIRKKRWETCCGKHNFVKHQQLYDDRFDKSEQTSDIPYNII